jgi:hypothetical protein
MIPGFMGGGTSLDREKEITPTEDELFHCTGDCKSCEELCKLTEEHFTGLAQRKKIRDPESNSEVIA